MLPPPDLRTCLPIGLLASSARCLFPALWGPLFGLAAMPANVEAEAEARYDLIARSTNPGRATL